MRLEDPLQADAVCVLLDVEGRVDDDGGSGVGVADEVRRAAEILVHELPEKQHER
jgi:hypothetical protein